MTVEQLNIIITAQTTDFQEKISAVNEALRETISLSENAAISAAAVASGASGVNEPAAAAYRFSAENGAEKESVFPSSANIANVLRLNRNQTLIGAVAQDQELSGAREHSAPLEIHTTVELDGDRIGEAVSAYNQRRNRITDGFAD